MVRAEKGHVGFQVEGARSGSSHGGGRPSREAWKGRDSQGGQGGHVQSSTEAYGLVPGLQYWAAATDGMCAPCGERTDITLHRVRYSCQHVEEHLPELKKIDYRREKALKGCEQSKSSCASASWRPSTGTSPAPMYSDGLDIFWINRKRPGLRMCGCCIAFQPESRRDVVHDTTLVGALAGVFPG